MQTLCLKICEIFSFQDLIGKKNTAEAVRECEVGVKKPAVIAQGGQNDDAS
jgi:hypothetical protein